MKIYILRHEDRTQDCSFFAPLTKLGLENSIKLKEKIEKEKLDINIVFSSPFIRTLQTIYPYVKEHNLKINVEYGLSEIHHEDIIAKKAVGITLPEYIAESFNYNPEYEPIIKPNEINYPEDDKQLKIRVKKVLKEIIKNFHNKDRNIVIVTHQGLCSWILKIVSKHIKIDEEEINNYKMGKLTLVYDGDTTWTYKPIN